MGEFDVGVVTGTAGLSLYILGYSFGESYQVKG